MSLKDIFQETLAIAEGLEYGEISFTYDKLACAMKMGHPAEFVMEALDEIYLKVRDEIPPTQKEIDTLLKSLKRIKRNFKIKELSKPIKDLTAYLAQMEPEGSL